VYAITYFSRFSQIKHYTLCCMNDSMKLCNITIIRSIIHLICHKLCTVFWPIKATRFLAFLLKESVKMGDKEDAKTEDLRNEHDKVAIFLL